VVSWPAGIILSMPVRLVGVVCGSLLLVVKFKFFLFLRYLKAELGFYVPVMEREFLWEGASLSQERALPCSELCV